MEYQNNEEISNSGTDLLYDMPVHLVQASGGKRFANYIIDVIVFYIFYFLIFFGWALINPDSVRSYGESANSYNFIDTITTMIIFGFFMGLIEAIFKGKTLGKLITGTKAVNEDGTPITFGTALGRGFSRAVPFNALSALGTPSHPWHDKWTNTYVIDEKLSAIRTHQQSGY